MTHKILHIASVSGMWPPTLTCLALLAASIGSLSLASADLKYGLIKDIPRMKDTLERFKVDILRLLKSWFYKLVNIKMGDKVAPDRLRKESAQVQDAVWDAVWFHMAHAMKNNQSGEKSSQATDVVVCCCN